MLAIQPAFAFHPAATPAANTAARPLPMHVAHLVSTLFDEVGCGLIVCDGDGTIRFANHAARSELSSSPLLSGGGEQLRRSSGAVGELEAALRQAGERGRRSLVLLTRGPARLMASVLPLGPSGEAGGLVLVMLGRRQPCSDLALEMLAGSYGLTYAERRVLAALLREASPREIAEELKVKVSTVRTQILAIRSKLGTRSVDGVLLRAAEMPPMAPALRMAA